MVSWGSVFEAGPNVCADENTTCTGYDATTVTAGVAVFPLPVIAENPHMPVAGQWQQRLPEIRRLCSSKSPSMQSWSYVPTPSAQSSQQVPADTIWM